MNNIMKIVLTLVGVAMIGSMQASDSALVDALVKKGVLSDKEAKEIRADMEKEKKTGAEKIELASHVQKLKLYGAATVRYRWQDWKAKNGTSFAGTDRERLQYMLWVQGDYTFTDNFKAGVRLATGVGANDGKKQTFDNAFSKDAANDSVTVDLAYLQWDPDYLGKDWAVTLVAGKHLKTFTLDWSNWDTDINPEGFGEKIAYKGVKDWTFGWNGGQYLYDNQTDSNNDPWLIANQVVVAHQFSKDVKASISPLVLNLINTNQSTPATVTSGTALGSSELAEGYETVLYVPAEVEWNLWNLPWKGYYTYGHNFSANKAARAGMGSIGVSGIGYDGNLNDQADSHTIGLQVGALKKKGDWTVGTAWVQREAFASNADLIDADYVGQRNNIKGYRVNAGYNFTDFFALDVIYFHGDTLKDMVPTIAASNNDLSAVDELFVELNWKF